MNEGEGESTLTTSRSEAKQSNFGDAEHYNAAPPVTPLRSTPLRSASREQTKSSIPEISVQTVFYYIT